MQSYSDDHGNQPYKLSMKITNLILFQFEIEDSID